jgi:F-type H+-transporting ATPase subunit a
MIQAHEVPQAAQHAAEAAQHAADPAGGFNASETIIGHVANSPLDHPLIHIPKIAGIDFSITKHVLMIWIVAVVVFLIVTLTVRRYIKQDKLVPSGFMNALEAMVEFIRDSIALPNVGSKWVNTWTPLLLTLFVFIFTANIIGLIPVFDSLALINHTVLHLPADSFFSKMLHGGVTATGNFNVTAALASITFVAIIVAGTRAHGFIQHWKNLAPHGLPGPVYILLIPIEIMGMFVRPFALTMRLAANMTGGHIALLSIISFVFIFAELFGRAVAGVGVGLVLSVPMAVGISALEIIVVLVQAYVFTLLTAVFIGMAIHAHH